MSVTRCALLITNPGETGAENYCKGVYVDARSYQRLLLSAYGGAWEQSEIIVRDRPSKAMVQDDVKRLAAYTYSLIIFSGHGWYSSVNLCNVLTLRKDEDIAVDELLVGSIKRSVILDCCRKVYHEPIGMFGTKISAFNEAILAATGRIADPIKCRALYLGLIENAPTGVVVISSCGIGETAGDDEFQGGRYSSSLVSVADQWAKEEAAKPAAFGASYSSIVATHDRATVLTKHRSGNTQNPTITKPKSMPYYPFTVFA